jgi:MFS family permease
MIARSRRLVRSTVSEYRRALSQFSHNARAMLVFLAMGEFSLGILLTVFGIYVKTAGMSEAVVGSVEGVIAAVGAVVCLLAPVLIAGVGYKRLMLMSAALLGVARFGMAAFPFSTALLVFAAVDGLGQGIMQTVPVPFLSENSTPAERAHLFSSDLFVRVFAAFLGGLVGGLLPVLFGQFTTELGAYRATVAVAGVVLLLSLWPMLLVRETRKPAGHATRELAATMRAFTSWGHTARLMAPQVLTSVGAGMIIPFVSLYLKNHLGATITQVGFIQGTSQLLMGVAALSAPILARRFGLVRSTALVEAISLPFMLAIPLLGDLRIAALFFWARGALMNLSWPLWNQFTMEGVPSAEKPAVAGVLAFGWSAAWVVGSVVGGRIMTVSYTTPYFYATALYALGALGTYLLNKDHDVRPARMDEALGQEGPH